jgi:GTPase SAR1 family protein
MLGEDIVVCIVGNKIDLEKNRTVSKMEAERYYTLAKVLIRLRDPLQ